MKWTSWADWQGTLLAFLTPRAALFWNVLVVASILYLAWVWQHLLLAGSHVDAAAYWRAADGDPYALSQLGQKGALLYSPATSQVLAPFASLPLAVLVGTLLAVSLGAAVYLVGPVLTALLLILPLPYLWQDLSSGNVHTLVGAAVVLGFRYPAAWSFVLLTKLTPAVGLIWFLVRREWRALSVALGSTVAISAISFLMAPRLWAEWISVLQANAAVPPEGVFVPLSLRSRLLMAALLVWWGARHDQRWTVPAAAMLGLPAIWVYDGFAVLLGALALVLPPGMRHPLGSLITAARRRESTAVSPPRWC